MATIQDELAAIFNTPDRPFGCGEMLAEDQLGQTAYEGSGDPNDIITHPDSQWPDRAENRVQRDIDTAGTRTQSNKIVGEVGKYGNDRLGYRRG